jgi:HAD superfamily hydrolase (TIGR01484 family)
MQHPIKALIFDLDGTAVANSADGMPSLRLIEVVNRVKENMFVAAATGRPLFSCQAVIEALQIEKPCVIAGGTQLYDPVNKKVIWQKKIARTTVQKILDICSPYPFKIAFENPSEPLTAKELRATQDESVVYILGITKEEAEQMVRKLIHLEDLALHSAPSWEPGRISINVTNVEATKKTALGELLSRYDLKPAEVMAIGDSNNDIPLFESAGLKIAMGNATDELKQRADYITDTQENDGLAKAIEKFILKSV